MSEELKESKNSFTIQSGAVRLLIVILICIFVIEFGIMGLLELLPLNLIPERFEETVDSIVLVAILYPVLYFLIFRSLLQKESWEAGELERERERNTLQQLAFDRTLAEAAQDMIFVIDRDDRVRYVNPCAARYLGVTPEQVIGKPRTGLFPPDTAERQGRALERVFITGQPFLSESQLYLNGGRTIWIDNQLVPLRDGSGVVTAVMGISRDISGRKEAEEAQIAYVQELKDMNKLMIDRETKIIELKKELKQLQAK